MGPTSFDISTKSFLSSASRLCILTTLFKDRYLVLNKRIYILSPTPSLPLTPNSLPSHSPLTSLSLPSHSPLTPLSLPSHSPLTLRPLAAHARSPAHPLPHTKKDTCVTFHSGSSPRSDFPIWKLCSEI